MEPAAPHPPINLRPAQPKRSELSALHDSVLSTREFRHRPIRWVLGRFFVHTTNK
jgi:hypothetical protein